MWIVTAVPHQRLLPPQHENCSVIGKNELFGSIFGILCKKLLVAVLRRDIPCMVVSWQLFEWYLQVLQALYEAKRAELAKNGINTDLFASMDKYVTENDLANHCRRQTRQPDQIANGI